MADIDQATREKLASFGLLITLHSDPSYEWGYTWQGRDWTGPFSTPAAALHAAFTDAMLALQFRSDYSWVECAQPGETWRYGGETEGWRQVEQERDLEAELQAFANDVFQRGDIVEFLTAGKHIQARVLRQEVRHGRPQLEVQSLTNAAQYWVPVEVLTTHQRGTGDEKESE